RETGIATYFRHDLRVQHGAHGRALAVGFIRVPAIRQNRRIAFLVVKHNELGDFRIVFGERMDGQLAEIASEPHEVVAGQGLVRKNQHLVRRQSSRDRPDPRRVQGLAQIDAGYLGGQISSQSTDFEQVALFVQLNDVFLDSPFFDRRSGNIENGAITLADQTTAGYGCDGNECNQTQNNWSKGDDGHT